MMRRMFALLLALTLVLGMVPATALAEETVSAETVGETIPVETAVPETTEASAETTEAPEATTLPELTEAEEPTEAAVVTEETVPTETVEETLSATVPEMLFTDCGDALSWTLEGSILTVFGSGAMYDYSVNNDNPAPWRGAASVVTAIVIEEGVTSVGDYAFIGMGRTVSVSFPSTLERVGDYAFAYCEQLKSVAFAEGLLSIGQGAFISCAELKEAAVPGSVTAIGEEAFYDCGGITVTFGGTREVWQELYSGKIHVICTDGVIDPSVSCGDDLTWMLGEDGVLTISGTGEMYDYGDGGEALAPWNKHSGQITAIVLEEGVTTIGENAFLAMSQVTSVTLPSTLKAVGEYGFGFCRALTAITFPEGFASLGSYAFTYCEALTSVTLPGSLETVGTAAFRECEKLTVTFGGTMEQWKALSSEELPVNCTDGAIDPGAKCGKNLTWTVSDKGVLTVSGTGAMYNYSNRDVISPWHSYEITAAVLEEGVTSIGNYAFFGIHLGSVELPSTLQRVGEGAFAYCEQDLKELIFQDGLLEIGKNAFQNCKQLEAVRIPSTVQTINSRAFTNCHSLTVTYCGTQEQWEQVYTGSFANVTFDVPAGEVPEQGTTEEGLTWQVTEGVLTITGEGSLKADEDILGNADKVTAITIGEGITEIGDSAFSGFEALTTVTLPQSVTEIGSSAFADCAALTSIDLTHVQTLGGGCFFGCTALKLIDLSGNPAAVAEQKTVLTYNAAALPAAVNPADLCWNLLSSTREEFTDLREDGTLYVSVPAEVTVECRDTYTGLASTWTLTSGYSPLTLMPEYKEPMEVKLLTQEGADADNEMQLVRFDAYLDKEDVASGTFVFTVYAANAGDTVDLTKPKNLKWTSTNTAVATVKANADGSATVTVKKKAEGAAVILLSEKVSGAEGSLAIHVRNYTPRLGDTAFNLNTLLADASVTTELVESYGCAIHPESVRLLEADGTPSERITASWSEGLLTLTPSGRIPNGTLKLTLEGTYANSELARSSVPFSFPIKVTVKNTAPAVTVKQTTKANLFYDLSLANLSVTVKNAQITDVALKDCDFAVEYWHPEYSTLTVYTKGENLKPDNKGTLKVWLEGYAEPVEKAVTIATEVKAPKLRPDYASATVNTALGQNSATVQLLDEHGYLIDMEETELQISGDFADWSVEGTRLHLENIEKSGTAVISVREPDWNQAVTLKYKVTVNKVLPTVKLGASMVELHSLFTQYGEWVTLELNQGGMKIRELEIAATGRNAAEAEKIALTYEYGVIDVSIADPENAPAPGTYTFNVTTILDNEAQTALKPVALKVKVVNTLPTVKLNPTTVKLNKALSGEVALAKASWKAVGKHMDFELACFIPAQTYPGLKLSYDHEGLSVSLTEEAVVGKQTVQLYPVFEDYNGQQITVRTPVKLTVQVYDSEKITVTLATKGKLDAIVPDSAIEYTVKKITNALGDVQEAALYGADADKFMLTPVATGDKGVQTFKLIQKEGVQYSTKTAYKVGVKLSIGGLWVETPVKTVKVTQSKLKTTILPKVIRYYQSQTGDLEATITLTAPEGASLSTKSIALNAAKTDKNFLRALGNGNLTVEAGELQVKRVYEKNGQMCVDVSFRIRHTGNLTPGKSLAVWLDITPDGNAADVAPTQLKLTVKAYK